MWFSLRMHKESREGFEKSSLQPLKQHSTSQKSSSRLTQRQLKVDASSLKPREVVDKALSSSPLVGWQQFKAKFQTLDVQTYNRCYLKALKKGREQNPNCTTIKKGLIYAEIRRVLKVGEIGGNATEAVTKGGHQEEASEEQEGGGSKTGDTALVRRLTNPTRKRSLYPISQRSREKGGAELSILVQSVGISSATWVPWSPTIPMSIPIHISVKHVESTSSQLKLSRNTRQKKCTGAMCVTGSLLVPWRCRSTTEILM